MTTAEYHAYLQSLESGQSSEPSEKIGELPASHFGRMSAAEYQAMLHPHKQPSGQPARKGIPQKKPVPSIPTESEEQQAVMKWAAAASGGGQNCGCSTMCQMRASGAWPLADDCARKV